MGLGDLEQQRMLMLTPYQREWVEGHVVLGAPDLRQVDTEELRGLFQREHAPSGTVSMAAILRTLIWQTWLLVMAGEVQPMRGNLRTFWYRVVEPLCLKHGLMRPEEEAAMLSMLQDNAIPELIQEEELDLPATSMLAFGEGGVRATYVLGAMGRILDRFVLEEFFTFREPFAFQDPRENFHTLGARRPAALFFTEKEGLWWLARELGHQFGISVMASHGEPGLLTLEYFCRQLHTRGVSHLHVGALTDYDPWGHAIAENFRKKLELRHTSYGFTVTLRRLTSIKLFTPERIAYSRRDLSKVSPAKRAQVNDWVRLTGGINGEPFGLHVDNAEISLIRAQVEEWFRELPTRSCDETPPPRPAPGRGHPTSRRRPSQGARRRKRGPPARSGA